MPETAEDMSLPGETTENFVESQNDTNCEKYLIFSVLDKLYSFPSRFISEIALFDTVYPLPLMPDYVLGVINRYSVPYALFDIGLLLFNNPGPRNKVLVLKDSIDRIAFLIDDVTGISDIPMETVLNVERSDEITEAVCASFNWEGSNVFVLDVQRILKRVSSEAV
jgi:purine-binding chemotaxis protein CheW